MIRMTMALTWRIYTTGISHDAILASGSHTNLGKVSTSLTGVTPRDSLIFHPRKDQSVFDPSSASVLGSPLLSLSVSLLGAQVGDLVDAGKLELQAGRLTSFSGVQVSDHSELSSSVFCLAFLVFPPSSGTLQGLSFGLVGPGGSFLNWSLLWKLHEQLFHFTRSLWLWPHCSRWRKFGPSFRHTGVISIVLWTWVFLCCR